VVRHLVLVWVAGGGRCGGRDLRRGRWGGGIGARRQGLGLVVEAGRGGLRGLAGAWACVGSCAAGADWALAEVGGCV